MTTYIIIFVHCFGFLGILFSSTHSKYFLDRIKMRASAIKTRITGNNWIINMNVCVMYLGDANFAEWFMRFDATSETHNGDLALYSDWHCIGSMSSDFWCCAILCHFNTDNINSARMNLV